MSPLGSTRIGAMQSNAFVKLTGAKVVNTGCDVAFGAGPTKPVKGAPVKFLFKGNNQESYREAWKDTITVADNGFVDDYFRAKGQPSIRLQLVEDVRPEEMKQAHVPRPDFFGANQTRKPLLCYHGNHMHVHSVLSFVKHIPTPFDLRLIVARRAARPGRLSIFRVAAPRRGSSVETDRRRGPRRGASVGISRDRGPRRGSSVETSRCRGRDVHLPWRRVAAAARDVDLPWRRRPRRGSSGETGRGATAAAMARATQTRLARPREHRG